jgi:DNA topoisomerase IA
MSRKVALLVAEKPSVARSVASFLAMHAKSSLKQVPSASQYNPIYEFDYPLASSKDKHLFRVTSVSGHIMNTAFDIKDPQATEWNIEKLPYLLTEAKVTKVALP